MLALKLLHGASWQAAAITVALVVECLGLGVILTTGYWPEIAAFAQRRFRRPMATRRTHVPDTRSLNARAATELLQTKRGGYAILARDTDGTERLVEVLGFHTATEAELTAVSWQLANMVPGREYRARPATIAEIESRKPKIV